MKLVLGRRNATFLADLHSRSYPAARVIWAAVAYADKLDAFIRHLCSHPDVQLRFYGRLDQDGAVALPLLRWFLDEAPSTARCFLINGPYHPKIIWWRGYGAYIGSANLTSNGWGKNIEAGTFFPEAELEAMGAVEELLELFTDLDQVGLELSPSILSKLETLAQQRRTMQPGIESLRQRFEQLFGNEKKFAGQGGDVLVQVNVTRPEQRFIDEWRATAETMRKVCAEFERMNRRPGWVPADVHATVHFDQFLHAYYYHYLKIRAGEGTVADKVARIHASNSRDPLRALKKAAEWWFDLDIPPTASAYNELTFMVETAPRMRELLTQDALREMNLETFTQLMGGSHAFREHAGHAERGVGAVSAEPLEVKVRRTCEKMWRERTGAGRSVTEVLDFVIYGTSPRDVERRLWTAWKVPDWHIDSLGRSMLGELIGWARPEAYCPRNDRNNYALQALGHQVVAFAST